jgi:hypothetical protein
MPKRIHYTTIGPSYSYSIIIKRLHFLYRNLVRVGYKISIMSILKNICVRLILSDHASDNVVGHDVIIRLVGNGVSADVQFRHFLASVLSKVRQRKSVRSFHKYGISLILMGPLTAFDAA